MQTPQTLSCASPPCLTALLPMPFATATSLWEEEGAHRTSTCAPCWPAAQRPWPVSSWGSPWTDLAAGASCFSRWHSLALHPWPCWACGIVSTLPSPHCGLSLGTPAEVPHMDSATSLPSLAQASQDQTRSCPDLSQPSPWPHTPTDRWMPRHTRVGIRRGDGRDEAKHDLPPPLTRPVLALQIWTRLPSPPSLLSSGKRNTISKIISQLYPREEAIQTPFIFFFKENRRVAIIFCQNRTGKPQLPWALWFTSWICFSKNHRKQVWQNDIRHTRVRILNSAIYALTLNISLYFHGSQIAKIQ